METCLRSADSRVLKLVSDMHTSTVIVARSKNSHTASILDANKTLIRDVGCAAAV
jgi:hypothetical protein